MSDENKKLLSGCISVGIIFLVRLIAVFIASVLISYGLSFIDVDVPSNAIGLLLIGGLFVKMAFKSVKLNENI